MSKVLAAIERGQAALALFEPKMEGDVEQHGVKGMRWGVRKDRTEQDKEFRARAKEAKKEGRALKKATKEERKSGASSDAAQAKALQKQIRKKGIQSLSNEQLQQLNQRMNLEQSYKTWAAKNPTLKQKAVQFAFNQVKAHGGDVVRTLNGADPQGQVAKLLKEATATGGKHKAGGNSTASKPQDHAAKPAPSSSQFKMKQNPAYQPGPGPQPKSDDVVYKITTL